MKTVKPSRGHFIVKLRGKLGLYVIFFCSLFFFFLAGLFTSTLISQEDPGLISMSRKLKSSLPETKNVDYNLLPQGQSGDDSITLIPFQVLSWKPRALYFPNFATAEQCESIISLAKPHLKPSTLALRKGETEESTEGVRTSSGVFISAFEDDTGVLDVIEEKIARASMIPKAHGEAFNILRYEVGQKYDSHYDAFNPSEYGPQKSQRNGISIPENYDFKECIGLKVKPRQGDGLLFYSLHPNNTIDPTSLHGSCAVTKGEKWVATKWIRDVEQTDVD
ncbi:Probable prolyl 4-hydroxylase 9 [Linum perenne]